MTTATKAKAIALEDMTFEQLQEELKGLPAQQQKAIHSGDVDGVIHLKGRTAAVKTQMSRIKIGNLKAEVDKCDQAVRQAMDNRTTVITEGIKQVEQAQADTQRLTKELQDAQQRHVRAVGQMDAVRNNLESAEERCRQARAALTTAMNELAAI